VSLEYVVTPVDDCDDAPIKYNLFVELELPAVFFVSVELIVPLVAVIVCPLTLIPVITFPVPEFVNDNEGIVGIVGLLVKSLYEPLVATVANVGLFVIFVQAGG
jgi:hypothetical protein